MQTAISYEGSHQITELQDQFYLMADISFANHNHLGALLLPLPSLNYFKVRNKKYFFITKILLMESQVKVNNPSPVKNQIKKGFKTKIEKATLQNANFRKVLYTSKHLQLVIMSLLPGEDIGSEVHRKTDQFFRFEQGHGKCVINENEYDIRDGDVVMIPAGAKHNIINVDPVTQLKMYTIYAPPNHKDGVVRSTKKEAEINEEEFDGITTEL
jgi:mannose-6-phosphate isomerase-like protein (cupin superfamily)